MTAEVKSRCLGLIQAMEMNDAHYLLLITDYA